MIRVRVLKNNVEVQFVDFNDEQIKIDWIDLLSRQGPWGLPERWIDGSNLSDAEKLLAVETRSSTGSLGEEVIEYKFAAEYSVIEEDISAEVAKKEAKRAAKNEAIVFLKDLKKGDIKNAEDVLLKLIEVLI